MFENIFPAAQSFFGALRRICKFPRVDVGIDPYKLS